MIMKPLVLKYSSPAENSNEGWEKYSLPIGNGYMGANIFGLVEKERIQITENSLENPGKLGGLNNFAEIYIKFEHNNIHEYERGLCLDDGIAYCKYTCGEIAYAREYFVSYPDNVLVIKLTSSQEKGLSFILCPEIPFLKDYAKEPGDGGGKSGKVVAQNDTITLSGKANYYNILFEGQLKVISNSGTATASEGKISVKGADSAVILFALGTNYKLCSDVFLEEDPKKKLRADNPHHKVEHTLQEATKKSYEILKERHISDYSNIFGRVSLDLEGEYEDLPTDVLLRKYGKGEIIPYLEALYFQYGRYLLISSSRDGYLPCNLQGVWNCHDQSPWGSGYWHNINVQMNYWPVFNTNMAELFKPYIDFYSAFRPCAERIASEYIKENNPENYTDEPGDCGWTIGTASYAYYITGPGGHSGPGTGGLTTKLFWDYYDFTRDEEVLCKITYPALLSMSKFLTKTVKDYDGQYLASFSASPEQMIGGKYAKGSQYYHTVGCAFDQQMIYENGRDFLKSAELLQKSEKATRIQQVQMDKYNPVEVGMSGQIKEYAEENFYGEIGEYNHRHISQLMALYPGTLINSETPAWLDAAKVSLEERGDESTGWALAHRLNAWSRTGDGDRTYNLLRELLGKRTLPNLWDTHPPFQIDGNLGGTSGIAEMLLQSHEAYITILPAIPNAWQNGSFKGLVARGSFVVSVDWKDGLVHRIVVESKKGGILKLHYNNLGASTVTDASGNRIPYECVSSNRISLETEVDEYYVIDSIEPYKRVKAPVNLLVERTNLLLTWEGEEGLTYNVYRAVNSEPCYVKLVEGLTDCVYQDNELDFSMVHLATYKVTASRKDGSGESDGPTKTINHATQLDIERYEHLIRQLNR